jgi:hypothetical protein
MAANQFSVKVTGLGELRTALRAMGGGLDDAMVVELFQIASLIAQRTQSVMPVRTGHARSTVRPYVTRGGAKVSEGTGAADDYVGWLDFGGHVGRHGSISREVIRTGRYLYPQGLKARPETIAALDAAIDHAAAKAGLATEGHLNA